jgi:hypothetical protein
MFTPVNTCSVYSLEALQADFDDPFLGPPTPVFCFENAIGRMVVQLILSRKKNPP